jgi:hypothetical protein
MRAGLVSLIYLLLLPLAAAAAPTVVRVSAPSSALTGTATKITVTVASPRPGRRVRITLSAVAPGTSGGGLSLRRARIVKLRKGRSSASVRVTFPDGATGRFALSACIGRSCATSKSLRVLDGSAYGRIVRAKLPKATEVLFALYALTGDHRLPARYRGAGEMPAGQVMAEAAELYPTLDPAGQAKLLPFLVPPVFAESAWRRRTRASKSVRYARAAAPAACSSLHEVAAWQAVRTANGKANIWYAPGDRAVAARFAAELSRTIWPKLTGPFGEPLGDGGNGCDPTGDPRLDIYLGTPDPFGPGGALRGVAVPLPGGADCTHPVFLVIDPTENRSVLAHEFFHAIQFAHPHSNCNGGGAWVEGSATWVKDFVYPRDQDEHLRTGHLAAPQTGLLAQDYATWPFWYWVYRTAGVGGFKRVFTGLEKGSLPSALDSALAGGREAAWKQWSVARMNRAPIGVARFPVAKSLKQWDSFAEAAGVLEKTLALTGRTERTIGLQTSTLAPLATDFGHVVVTDPKVRFIRVTNGAYGKPGGQLQALVKRADGSWRIEDWSGRATISFCRDRAADNVREFYLVTGNASGTAALPTVRTTVTGRNTCSFPRTFTGTFASVWTNVSGGFTLRFSGNATFVRSSNNPPVDVGSIVYDLTGGSVSLQASGTNLIGCTASGGTTVPLQSNPVFQNLMKLNLENVAGDARAPHPEPKPYYFSIWLEEPDSSKSPTYTRTCDPDPPAEVSAFGGYLRVGFRDWWVQNPPEIQKSDAADLLSGHRSRDGGAGITIDETWEFRGAD